MGQQGKHLRRISPDNVRGILERHQIYIASQNRGVLVQGERADMSHCDLRGFNFIDAKLIAVNLNGANLRGADLQGANLRYADLSKSNLVWAYLECADLQDANLTSAILINTKLDGADLSNANLTNANLSGADLTGLHGLLLWDLCRAEQKARFDQKLALACLGLNLRVEPANPATVMIYDDDSINNSLCDSEALLSYLEGLDRNAIAGSNEFWEAIAPFEVDGPLDFNSSILLSDVPDAHR